MRKMMFAAIAALAIFTLAGCGGGDAPTGYAPGQTTEAYAYVHGGYVGQAVITTDDEGSISATLNEAFLPHTLAIVDMESGDWNEDNTVFYVQRGNEVRVAKYVSYAGTNYTGVTVGTALAYVESDEDGNPAGGTILEKGIIRNEGAMSQWFNSIDDGAFMIYTEFGGAGEAVTTTGYGSLYKRGSQYWTDRGQTWQGNMEAIEEFAAENGVAYSLDEFEQDSDNVWEADATTGATASDFKDYFALIQTAVSRLRMQ